MALRKKSGSALLLTLLTLAGASIITLAAAEAVRTSSRTVNVNDSSQVAYAMAESGIEEGMYRVSNPATSLQTAYPYQGEYGDTTSSNCDQSNYCLLPLRRGFKAATDIACSQISDDDSVANTQPKYDPGCPYYDLSIRRSFSISGTNPYDVGYSAVELPLNKAVTLAIRSNPGFTLVVSADSASKVGYSYSGGASAACSPGGSNSCLSSTQSLQVPAGATSLTLTVTAGPLVATSNNPGIVVANMTSGVPLIMEKGTTTIESDGYAGGVQRKLLVTIPFGSPTINYSQDFSNAFDQHGVLCQQPAQYTSQSCNH